MADRTATTAWDPEKRPDAAQTPDLQEQARELGAQVQERAQELGAQVHERVQEISTQVHNWAQDVGSQLKEGAQGAMHKVEASASQLSEQGRETVDQLEKVLEGYIRAKPLQSLMIAAGVGMLVGLLWRK
jgi:ElaB/YqjD/DUF883 family membrane-anchored ribosome-binding protein